MPNIPDADSEFAPVPDCGQTVTLYLAGGQTCKGVVMIFSKTFVWLRMFDVFGEPIGRTWFKREAVIGATLHEGKSCMPGQDARAPEWWNRQIEESPK